jgi:Nitrile hydratase beta subunit, N-terminal
MRDQPGAGAGEVGGVRFQTLDRIATSEQVWPRVSQKYGVTNPVPPWKSSLHGICDALDRSGAALAMVERRREEDLLSMEAYSVLPYPESQLVALAHSLLTRGVIEEHALARRMEAVRARLQGA